MEYDDASQMYVSDVNALRHEKSLQHEDFSAINVNDISIAAKPQINDKAPIYRHYVSFPVAPDSTDVVRLEKHHFWRAGAETVRFNIRLWAFDRYVLNSHYALISWNNIKANFMSCPTNSARLHLWKQA